MSMCPPFRIWVYKRRFWWSACDPDEVLGTVDTHTWVRAFTREKVIEKARRRWLVDTEPRHEEVVLRG